MKELTFEIESNDEIWELIDKSVEYIFIHKFSPVRYIQWRKADLLIEGEVELKNISVREMEFDLQTDLSKLQEIIALNTNHLSIYQFEKPVPDTLALERLPEESKFKILQSNGLKHFFWINFEFLTISSFDKEFISNIEQNPQFRDRIKKRKTENNKSDR